MEGDFAGILPVVVFTSITFAFVFVCFCIFCFVMAALTSNDYSPKRAKPGRGARIRRMNRPGYTTETSSPRVWTTASAVWAAHKYRYAGIYRYIHWDGSYGYVRLSRMGFVDSSLGQSSFGSPVTIVSVDDLSAGDSGTSISSDGCSSDRNNNDHDSSFTVSVLRL